MKLDTVHFYQAIRLGNTSGIKAVRPQDPLEAELTPDSNFIVVTDNSGNTTWVNIVNVCQFTPTKMEEKKKDTDVIIKPLPKKKVAPVKHTGSKTKSSKRKSSKK